MGRVEIIIVGQFQDDDDDDDDDAKWIVILILSVVIITVVVVVPFSFTGRCRDGHGPILRPLGPLGGIGPRVSTLHSSFVSL